MDAYGSEQSRIWGPMALPGLMTSPASEWLNDTEVILMHEGPMIRLSAVLESNPAKKVYLGSYGLLLCQYSTTFAAHILPRMHQEPTKPQFPGFWNATASGLPVNALGLIPSQVVQPAPRAPLCALYELSMADLFPTATGLTDDAIWTCLEIFFRWCLCGRVILAPSEKGLPKSYMIYVARSIGANRFADAAERLDIGFFGAA